MRCEVCNLRRAVHWFSYTKPVKGGGYITSIGTVCGVCYERGKSTEHNEFFKRKELLAGLLKYAEETEAKHEEDRAVMDSIEQRNRSDAGEE